VIAPEQQGHGHTPDLDRPLSFEQMADDTAALLEQLGVHDADILGFSNGGTVALQIALRHPELVHRLIICSSFYAHDGVIPQLRDAWQQPPDPSKMPPPLRDAYLAAAPHPDLARFVAKTIAMLQSFTDIPESGLRTIAVPTLVMVGDHDVVRVEHALKLSQLVQHGQLAVFPDSIHGTYLGAVEGEKPGNRLPDLGATMIDTFLTR
jgi:pimeloyl-ACP methyl ester carboxylesterase